MGGITCKNCSTEFEGNFCPECGQRGDLERITLKYAFTETLDTFFNLNKGLRPTIWHLLTRPGNMLQGYLAGKRRSYIPPFRFLLGVIALSYLMFFVLFPGGWAAALESSSDSVNLEMERTVTKVIGDMMSKNYTLFSVSQLPFLSFFVWLFFRRSGYNLAEHLTAMTYIMAMVSLLPMPLIFLVMAGVIDPAFFFIGMGVIMLIYTFIALLAWLKAQRRFWGSVRALLGVGLGTMTWWVTISILVFAVAFQRGDIKLEDFAPSPVQDSLSTGADSLEGQLTPANDSSEALFR